VLNLYNITVTITFTNCINIYAWIYV